MATIKEVAARARVSPATVSRVINASKYVSPGIRARVEEAIEALDYQPSALAVGLRRQYSKTVGVLVPRLNDLYFGHLCYAIEKSLRAHDYRPFFSSTVDDHNQEIAYLDMLLRHRVDGVVLVPAEPVSHSLAAIQRLLERGVPIVLVDRGTDLLEIDQVLSTNYRGGRDAAEHLVNFGHRRIALIGAHLQNDVEGVTTLSTGAQRFQGVRQAMAEHTIPLDPGLIVSLDFPHFDLGYQEARVLLRDHPEVTAVFAIGDQVAVGVLHAAAERDLDIPADLSVIGYDDIPLASHVIPRLTTIAQPIFAMGTKAVQVLLDRIRDPAAGSRTILLETRLVRRNSTAPVRAGRAL